MNKKSAACALINLLALTSILPACAAPDNSVLEA